LRRRRRKRKRRGEEEEEERGKRRGEGRQMHAIPRQMHAIPRCTHTYNAENSRHTAGHSAASNLTWLTANTFDPVFHLPVNLASSRALLLLCN